MVARPASTLILLRAAAAPVEVLMIKRAPALFGGGWWVFPGGAVDDADRHPGGAETIGGIDDEDRPWVLAALRETAEEVGLCLSRPAIDPAALDRSDVAGALAAHAAVFDGESVAYLSNWITPVGVPKRFDTRFFVAEWPHDIDPAPDGDEVVECAWVSPRGMLDSDRDEYPLIFPTIKHLELLAGFDSPGAVLAHARATHVEPILPRRVEGDGFMRLLLPGEPGYAETGP